VWPAEKPIGVRISATDWAEGGWNVDDSVALARELRSLGCDYICASSGGVVLSQKITMGPGYQVPFAEKIRRESGIATMAVGQITEPDQAEAILAAGQADLIALGRRMLYDPRWAWHAAVHFGIHLPYHFRYRLCHPSMGPMLNFPETKENTQLLSKLRTADQELALDRSAAPGTVHNQI
jgi:2,4-dienoyl-CoA reductase-like NADH-dependent reductase (Old Yellow Enzyme family)